MKDEIKFQNRYRISSNRLPGWDYGNEGAYFLTICTYHKECLFGEIVDQEMILNDYGLIVQREWLRSARLRSEIVLGPYVVMPNHFHAIVHIVVNNDVGGDMGEEISNGVGGVDGVGGVVPVIPVDPVGGVVPVDGIAPVDDVTPVETHGRASLHHHHHQQQQQRQHPQPPTPHLYRSPKSVSSLMAGFKSVVCKQINMIRGTSGKKIWQANYYDHIIRNDKEYRRIADYIEKNPACWLSDSMR